jgi:quercetin dioxygenase-like cupin family protein
MTVKHIKNVAVDSVAAGTGASRQVLIGPEEGPNFAMRRYIMEPGGGIPAHSNTVEHEQYVLRGKARIGVGEEALVPRGERRTVRVHLRRSQLARRN